YGVLGSVPAVPERQRALPEQSSRAPADPVQLLRAESRQNLAGLALISQIAANQPDIRLADLDERLARPVMRRADRIQAAVWPPAAQDRNMHHHQYTPSTTVF